MTDGKSSGGVVAGGTGSSVEYKATSISSESTLTMSARKTFEICLEKMKTKNHDYTVGSKDCFANFRDPELQEVFDEMNSVLKEHGILGGVSMNPEELGIRTRLKDKWKRISTGILLGIYHVKDENFDDTIEDAINYLAILKAIRQERLKALRGQV